jgi:hypothetical protein
MAQCKNIFLEYSVQNPVKTSMRVILIYVATLNVTGFPLHPTLALLFLILYIATWVQMM